MNAHKFVAEQGIDEAKRVLGGAPDWANFWISRDQYHGHIISFPNMTGHYSIDLSELKQVVESLGVICRACGAERIIELHNMYKSNPVGHEYWLEISVNRMEKAIADYELIESYKSSNGQTINKTENQENNIDLKEDFSTKQDCETVKHGEAVKQYELTESHINESYKLNRLG